MLTRTTGKRRTACACDACPDIKWCMGFVPYDHLEWAKAKKLFEETPLNGCNGEFFKPYKKCDACWGHR